MALMFGILWVIAGILVVISKETTKSNNINTWKLRSSFMDKWQKENIADSDLSLAVSVCEMNSEQYGKAVERIMPYMEKDDEYVSWLLNATKSRPRNFYNNDRYMQASSQMTNILLATYGKVDYVFFAFLRIFNGGQQIKDTNKDRCRYYIGKILDSKGVDSRWITLNDLEVEKMITEMEEDYYRGRDMMSVFMFACKQRMKDYVKTLNGVDGLWSDWHDSDRARAYIPDWYFEKYGRNLPARR